MEHNDRDELARAYQVAVERERAAWQGLQDCAPGTDERAQAWTTWTRSIVQTNRAWRELSTHRATAATRQRERTSPHA